MQNDKETKKICSICNKWYKENNTDAKQPQQAIKQLKTTILPKRHKTTTKYPKTQSSLPFDLHRPASRQQQGGGGVTGSGTRRARAVSHTWWWLPDLDFYFFVSLLFSRGTEPTRGLLVVAREPSHGKTKRRKDPRRDATWRDLRATTERSRGLQGVDWVAVRTEPLLAMLVPSA